MPSDLNVRVPGCDPSNWLFERCSGRCSAATLATLKEAAALQDQDLTSFILGAALDRARGVLAEDRSLRLSPHEVLQLERALDAEPSVVPQLAALIKGTRTTPRVDA